jgi:hypothetical protein
MTLTRDESGFRHRLRVRLGANGPLGRLLHIEKKDKSGWYWKVKLDSGEWVWPADLHVDGTGRARAATAASVGCRSSATASRISVTAVTRRCSASCRR